MCQSLSDAYQGKLIVLTCCEIVKKATSDGTGYTCYLNRKWRRPLTTKPPF